MCLLAQSRTAARRPVFATRARPWTDGSSDDATCFDLVIADPDLPLTIRVCLVSARQKVACCCQAPQLRMPPQPWAPPDRVPRSAPLASSRAGVRALHGIHMPKQAPKHMRSLRAPTRLHDQKALRTKPAPQRRAEDRSCSARPRRFWAERNSISSRLPSPIRGRIKQLGIFERPCADGTGPAGVVPRHAEYDVMRRQSACDAF
jgi:hypothetical protein